MSIAELKQNAAEESAAQDEQSLQASQRSQQHMAALLREGSAPATGLLASLVPDDIKPAPRRAVRLGRL